MLDLCSAIYCNAGHHAQLYTGKKHSSVQFPWWPGQEAAAQPLVGQAQACGAPQWPCTPAGAWPGCARQNRRTGHITERCDPQHKGEPTQRILSRDHSVIEEDENKLSDNTGEVEKNPIPALDIQNILPTLWPACHYPSAWGFGVNVSVTAMICAELHAAHSDMHCYSQRTWNVQIMRGWGSSQPPKPLHSQNGSLCQPVPQQSIKCLGNFTCENMDS